MRVLVRFSNKKGSDFEGTNARKIVNSALEMNDVTHTRLLGDDFDIAHLFSKGDLASLKEINKEGIPCVVSAFYCENDKEASFVKYSFKDKEITNFIDKKSIRFLNKASLILVPNNFARKKLVEMGVVPTIIVQPFAANTEKFKNLKDEDKALFRKYFSVIGEKKIVLGIGPFARRFEALRTFSKMARENPNALFYFIGTDSNLSKVPEFILRKIYRKYPKNLKIVGLLSNDIYVSALNNADLLVFPGKNVPGIITIVEAMANKTQLFARNNEYMEDVLKDKENCYLANTNEELVSLVSSYLNEDIKSTCEQAYNEIKERNLSNFGKELIELYKQKI